MEVGKIYSSTALQYLKHQYNFWSTCTLVEYFTFLLLHTSKSLHIGGKYYVLLHYMNLITLVCLLLCRLLVYYMIRKHRT